jgi:hypothetical protein
MRLGPGICGNISGMKRSETVRLGLLLGIAASLTSCQRTGPTVTQRCVDANGVVVADQSCQDWDQQRRDTYRPGYVYPHRWYYGGWGSAPGTRVGGGSYEPPPHASYMRPNSGGTVIHGGRSSTGSSTRGVFGGTGSGHASGHGASAGS